VLGIRGCGSPSFCRCFIRRGDFYFCFRARSSTRAGVARNESRCSRRGPNRFARADVGSTLLVSECAPEQVSETRLAPLLYLATFSRPPSRMALRGVTFSDRRRPGRVKQTVCLRL